MFVCLEENYFSGFILGDKGRRGEKEGGEKEGKEGRKRGKEMKLIWKWE